MHRPLRIVYAAGPGDVLGTYQHWKEGRDDPGQVGMTYSGQFYEVCREFGAEAYIISSNARQTLVRDGSFTIEHRPIPLQNRRGLAYHFGQFWSTLLLMTKALRFRADVLIVSTGSGHWFPLAALSWLSPGMKVVPSLHCVLWQKARRPRGAVSRLLGRLDRVLFAKTAFAILSVSRDISSQVGELVGGSPRPIREFLPTYRPSQFAGLSEPSEPRNPFRVLCVGRIERNKGVFDLLEVARLLAGAKRDDVTFDICGNGTALDELRRMVDEAGLTDRFRCHGHCDKPTMRDMYNRSHVVIAPTTSQFVEGFNKVVAEGVLAGRPVIASTVCPALDYVPEASIGIPPDDVQACANAILALCDDPELYRAKADGCRAAQSQFYDETRGWAAGLREVFIAVRTQRSLGVVSTPPAASTPSSGLYHRPGTTFER